MGSVKAHLNRVGSQMESLGSKLSSTGTALTAAITVPILGVSAAALKVAGDLEQASVAFTTLLGSADRAGQHLDALKKFAMTTPFEFPELVNASKRLQALGFTAKEIIPTLTSVGNAASALGTGAVGIERITLALGQMRAKGKVSAEEMRQLAEAGIPAWQILADAIGKTEKKTVSVAEVMKRAEKGFIDGNMAAAALLEGMQSKFGGLMERQSVTLLGQLSNFKDKVTFVLGDIGAALAPTAKRILDAFSGVVDQIGLLAKAFRELPEGIQTGIVAFAGIAAAVGPALFIFGQFTASVGVAMKALAAFAPAATAAGASIGAAGLAGAFTVLGTAVAVAAAAFLVFEIGSIIYDLGKFALSFDAVQKAGNAVKSVLGGVWDAIKMLPEVKVITLVFKVLSEGVASGNIGWLDLLMPGLTGLKKSVAELTGSIDVGKELGRVFGQGGFKVPSFKEATEDVQEYARQVAAKLRAAEEAAAKHAAEMAKIFSLLGIQDSLKVLKETEKAFDALFNSDKLQGSNLVTAAQKLQDRLEEAFRAGVIGANEFDRVMDKIRTSLADVADKARNFKITTFLADAQFGAESFKTAGDAFVQWMKDVQTNADAAQGRLKVMTDGVEALGVELAALPNKGGALIPPEALKGMEDSVGRSLKIMKEGRDTLLREVGVSQKSAVDTMIAANAEIQASNSFTDRQKLESARNTLRAIIQENKAAGLEITAEQERQLASLNKQLGTTSEVWKNVQHEISTIFNDLGRGVADAIIHFKSFGDSAIKILENIGEAIVRLLIKNLIFTDERISAVSAALTNLFKKAFSGGASTASKSVPGIPLPGLGGLGGRSGAPPVQLPSDMPVGGDIDLGGGAAAKGTTGGGGGGILGNFDPISAGIAAAAGVTAGIQAARMTSLLSGIELSTRATKEHLVGGIQPSLNTWLPKLDHLYSIWKELQDGFGKLNAILLGLSELLTNVRSNTGLGGGFWGTAGGPGSRTAQELQQGGWDGYGGLPDMVANSGVRRRGPNVLGYGSVGGAASMSPQQLADMAAAALAPILHPRGPETFEERLAALRESYRASNIDLIGPNQVKAVADYLGITPAIAQRMMDAELAKNLGTATAAQRAVYERDAANQTPEQKRFTDLMRQMNAGIISSTDLFNIVTEQRQKQIDADRESLTGTQQTTRALSAYEQQQSDLTTSALQLRRQLDALQQSFYAANSAGALFDLARSIGPDATRQSVANNAAALTAQANQLSMAGGAAMQSSIGSGAILPMYTDQQIEQATARYADYLKEIDRLRGMQQEQGNHFADVRNDEIYDAALRMLNPEELQGMQALRHLNPQSTEWQSYITNKVIEVGKSIALNFSPYGNSPSLRGPSDRGEHFFGALNVLRLTQRDEAEMDEAARRLLLDSGLSTQAVRGGMSTPPINYAGLLSAYQLQLRGQTTGGNTPFWMGGDSLQDYSAFTGGSTRNASIPPGMGGSGMPIIIQAFDPAARAIGRGLIEVLEQNGIM